MDDFDIAVLEIMREFPTVMADYVQYTGGTYNPATGTITQSETVTSVQSILLDLTLSSNGLSTKFGTLVMAGDKNLLVRPPHKANPELPILQINTATDKVRVNGITYNVVTFKEVNPTGADPYLYDLYIRR